MHESIKFTATIGGRFHTQTKPTPAINVYCSYSYSCTTNPAWHHRSTKEFFTCQEFPSITNGRSEKLRAHFTFVSFSENISCLQYSRNNRRIVGLKKKSQILPHPNDATADSKEGLIVRAPDRSSTEQQTMHHTALSVLLRILFGGRLPTYYSPAHRSRLKSRARGEKGGERN